MSSLPRPGRLRLLNGEPRAKPIAVGPPPVRYAVVSAAPLELTSVLRAFERAPNSELVALLSADRPVRRALRERFGIRYTEDFSEVDVMFERDLIDAVYLALPSNRQRDVCERAARFGVHVLCERTLAATVRDGEAMIDGCKRHRTKLMVAHRWHAANRQAVELCKSKRLGEPRTFYSSFHQDPGAVDLPGAPTWAFGGSLSALGPHCINAARQLFGDEPNAVLAEGDASVRDGRPAEHPGVTAVTLFFSGDRVAHFTVSFSVDVPSSRWRVVGTRREVTLEFEDSAQGQQSPRLRWSSELGGAPLPLPDPFAPELIHFSRSIQQGVDPEPDGWAGLCDLRILEAAQRSARCGQIVEVA